MSRRGSESSLRQAFPVPDDPRTIQHHRSCNHERDLKPHLCLFHGGTTSTDPILRLPRLPRANILRWHTSLSIASDDKDECLASFTSGPAGSGRCDDSTVLYRARHSTTSKGIPLSGVFLFFFCSQASSIANLNRQTRLPDHHLSPTRTSLVPCIPFKLDNRSNS